VRSRRHQMCVPGIAGTALIFLAFGMRGTMTSHKDRLLLAGFLVLVVNSGYLAAYAAASVFYAANVLLHVALGVLLALLAIPRARQLLRGERAPFLRWLAFAALVAAALTGLALVVLGNLRAMKPLWITHIAVSAAAAVLLALLREESRHRQERSLAYRLQQARLPWDWSLDTFPFERQQTADASHIRALAGLGFIDRAENLVLIGPPGTGKTTLARIIANTTHAHFIALNAVLSGVKDIREAIEVARDKRGMFGQKTILFIDEVHRFNKAQQDALLPHVEDGTVTLIGATTENPYFEVNSALLSRLRVWRLEPLPDDVVTAFEGR